MIDSCFPHVAAVSRNRPPHDDFEVNDTSAKVCFPLRRDNAVRFAESERFPCPAVTR